MASRALEWNVESGALLDVQETCSRLNIACVLWMQILRQQRGRDGIGRNAAKLVS